MINKCELCKKEIKTTFLDKLDGTIIKTGEGETSKLHYICSDCQKEHKDNLKKKFNLSNNSPCHLPKYYLH